MYTQLAKILEHGLNGNTEKVRSYAELLVKNHYKFHSGSRSEEEERIAEKFRRILSGEQPETFVTLDDETEL